MAGMNDQIHFYVNVNEKKAIREKAKGRNETISDFCKRKIFEGMELDKFSKVVDLVADRFMDKISEGIIRELVRQTKKQFRKK
jgi:hypothetical protein